jgi:GT2 family glycosyltransferase
LSYVVISFNQRDCLLETLGRLHGVTTLPQDQWEIWVVDNASSDGSAAAVAEKFPHANLIRNSANQGSFAANHAFSRMNGKYAIWLNGDSFPNDARAVNEMLAHLDQNPGTAAVTAKVVLADGKSSEAPALAAILMPGASCVRKSAIDRVGGFRPELGHQAGEWDLSFRIWQGGLCVDRRDDIVFRRDAALADDDIHGSDSPRNSQFVRCNELRNNLIVAQRHFPDNLRTIYWDDWRLLYESQARFYGHGKAAMKAIWLARTWAAREAFAGGRLPLGNDAVESIFQIRQQARLVGEWARRNSVWRVAIADFGKNIWATYNACHASGLQLRCVADECPAFEGLQYRGLPIIPAHDAFAGGGIDGVVVSNLNPSQATNRAQSLCRLFKGPVLRLWAPPRLAAQTRVAA